MKTTIRARFHAVVRFWNGGINHRIHNLSIERNSFALQMLEFPNDSGPWARAQLAYALCGFKIEMLKSFIIKSNATGESRAIARTLHPIVGNLDSEVTQ